MKAIIELSRKASIFAAVAQQIAGVRRGRTPDYRLSFESARSLFADLTPARLDLLDTLRRAGPSSVYALAKAAERNYSNVHTDVSRLEELGLIERAENGLVQCRLRQSRSAFHWHGSHRRRRGQSHYSASRWLQLGSLHRLSVHAAMRIPIERKLSSLQRLGAPQLERWAS